MMDRLNPNWGSQKWPFLPTVPQPWLLTSLSLLPFWMYYLKLIFLKFINVFMWAIPGLFFFIFVFSIQSIVNKICRSLDSNRGSLVLEVTALPTEPQPVLVYIVNHLRRKLSCRQLTCPKRKCPQRNQTKGYLNSLIRASKVLPRIRSTLGSEVE